MGNLDFNKLPFSHLVWFMENGDDQWRPCAATMDEQDAQAIMMAADPTQGAMQVTSVDEHPLGGAGYYWS